jgi:hypothetical protein
MGSLNLLPASTRVTNSEKCFSETEFRFLFKFDSLILPKIGLEKTARSITNTSTIRRINEKKNHHKGIFTLKLSKYVPAMTNEIMTLINAVSSVILELFFSSG